MPRDRVFAAGSACSFGSLILCAIVALCGCHRHAASNEHHETHSHGGAVHTGVETAPHGHDAAAAIPHELMHPHHDPSSPCMCDAARLHNGWCGRCNVGYIGGQQLAAPMLFHAIDPHGHELDLKQIDCESCVVAMNANGFCDTCGMGYLNGMTYFSRLTWGLAHAKSLQPQQITCQACRTSAAPAWCNSCARGMIGPFAFTQRRVFDETAQEYAILLSAIERNERCESCAAAMVLHKVCPICSISYRKQ